jgi:hypothetical protein
MPQTAREFEEAYRAGWKDRHDQRDYDPGASMPDTVIHIHDMEARIPVYVPGFRHGNHTDGIIGNVILDGNQALLTLTNGEDFAKRLTHGAYIGMTVQFPVGFNMSSLNLDLKQPPKPEEILNGE